MLIIFACQMFAVGSYYYKILLQGILILLTSNFNSNLERRTIAMEMFYIPFLFIFLYFLYKWMFPNSPGNLPPGPKGIPIFGYLPFFKKYPYIEMRDIGKKYGNSLVSIQLGLKSVIVLNDWKAVKEAMLNQSDNFSARPPTIIFNEIRRREGITESDGPKWKERRHFTMKTMRHLGFRDIFMEAIILEEVEKLTERLKNNFDRKVVNMEDLFINHFLNIIWGVSAGKKFEEDDQRNSDFAHFFKITSIQNASTNILEFLPFLKYVPKYNSQFQDFVNSTNNLHRYLEEEIDEHVKTYEEDNIRDFIDAFLQEMFKRQKKNTDPEIFQRKTLKALLYNLFNGGVDTGSNTLTWAILYMATWPKIQKKVQRELDRVIGRGRMPIWADHVNLPYIAAVLCEIHRFSSILPLTFPHSCHATTKVCGFTVPKNAHMLVNIWAVHNDPNYWGDPEIFRPERFINDKGELEKPEYLIPFLTGKRVCIGQNLASMELFLFLSSILHQFKVNLVTGEALPSFKPVLGLSSRPEGYSVYIKRRN